MISGPDHRRPRRFRTGGDPHRTHGAPPEQAAPLMPPQLFDILEACPPPALQDPRERVTPGRPAGPGAAAGRFFAALRRPDRRADEGPRPQPGPAGQLRHLTPTWAAPRIGRSRTRPDTDRWPRSGCTCSSTKPGRTTSPPCSGCSPGARRGRGRRSHQRRGRTRRDLMSSPGVGCRSRALG